MIFAIFPVIVLVVGILLWALATHPIVKDAGRCMFIVGMAVTTWVASRATIHIP